MTEWSDSTSYSPWDGMRGIAMLLAYLLVFAAHIVIALSIYGTSPLLGVLVSLFLPVTVFGTISWFSAKLVIGRTALGLRGLPWKGLRKFGWGSIKKVEVVGVRWARFVSVEIHPHDGVHPFLLLGDTDPDHPMRVLLRPNQYDLSAEELAQLLNERRRR